MTMDLRSQYASELFSQIMLNPKNTEALLEMLIESNLSMAEQFERMTADISFIKTETGYIKEKVTDIDKKIDLMLELLNKLQYEFAELKNENREVEQKLMLLHSKLSKIENEIDEDELNDYVLLCQSLYDCWQELEEVTKKLLPVSELLFSKLQKYEKTDFSPVILELCRALENEMLTKIFVKYTHDLIRRKGKVMENFLYKDRGDKNLLKKTGVFVKAISKANKTRKPEYTLGQMRTIISLLNEDDVIESSPLLQDFEQYIIDNTEYEILLSDDYINDLSFIIDEFRNPSAHPSVMGIEKANKCKELMPERIDQLVNSLKN